MRNQLNSVLIEGHLKKTLTVEEGTSLNFNIISIRYWRKSDDTYEKHEIPVRIVVPNADLAETCIKILKKGRGMRIVGRLDLFFGKLAVYAEHIEFKPTTKTEIET